MKYVLFCFIFLGFHLSLSAQNRALMLLNNEDSTKLIIEEKTFVKIQLKNHKNFQGELFFNSDSTIRVEGMEIPIHSVKFIKTEKTKQAIGFLLIGIGAPLFYVGSTNSHFSIGDESYVPTTSLQKNAPYFCCSGCGIGLTGLIMIISKLHLKKYDLKNKVWQVFIIKQIISK